MISAWIRGIGGGGTANAIVFGIIVAILAVSRLSGARPWVSWLDALIGIWMIISPWVYGYGIWSASASEMTDHTATR